MRATNKHTM